MIMLPGYLIVFYKTIEEGVPWKTFFRSAKTSYKMPQLIGGAVTGLGQAVVTPPGAAEQKERYKTFFLQIN